MNEETLPLDLTQEQAASLFLIIEQAIDTIQTKKSLLLHFKTIPKDQWPEELREDNKLDETLNLHDSLLLDAKEFSIEISQIIVELDKTKNKSNIILPKPNFKS